MCGGYNLCLRQLFYKAEKWHISSISNAKHRNAPPAVDNPSCGREDLIADADQT